MPWTEVTEFDAASGWTDSTAAHQLTRTYCQKLEAGEILYFPSPPFNLPDVDRQFLLGQHQSGFPAHKNISYRPASDELRGVAARSADESERLLEIMRRYSHAVTQFVDAFLSPYAGARTLDFASCRTIEEQNRELSVHKRNDLLHIDAFPTRPTRGGRILRVFVNFNPTRNRVWETTDGFAEIAKKYARAAGLDRATGHSVGRSLLKAFSPVLKAVGMKATDRSAYDRFMLDFHDWLKENDDFQKNYPKTRTEFPPNSVWLVYTDTVPHAVVSGQFALEQTFIVPVHANVLPETAPIRVLEAMTGRVLSG